MTLSPEQKKKLQKVLEIMQGGNLAIAKHLLEMENRMDELKGTMPNYAELIKKVRGDNGYTPKKGKDYFDGKDGYTPKKGVDYKDGENYILTDKDKKEIARSIKVPVVEKVIEKHKETVVKEIPVVKETIVKEPLSTKFSPQELRDLLELLQEDERLDAKYIKNLPEAIKKHSPQPMLHPVSINNLPDVNVVGATSGQVLTFNGIYWHAANGGSSGSGYQAPTSGAVNGVNQTFTWATAPKAIVVDNGRTIQKTSSDGTVNWTGTTTTVLTIAPNFDIFATA